MKKLVSILLTAACLSLSTAIFTSCSSLSSAGGIIVSAQAWLNDPKNQALIQEIAQAASFLIGAFGGEHKASATTKATVTGKLAVSYPNVPAGAIAEIAKNPNQYIKR